MCKSSRDCASYTECNLLLIVCLLSVSCFMCVFISFFVLFVYVCLSPSLSPTVSVLWHFNLK